MKQPTAIATRTAVTAAVEVLEARQLMSSYYLSPAGNDANPGTLAAPWRTLAKAAAAVAGGDEVVLRAGTYVGGVTFDDPNLLVRSHAGERAVISSPTTSSSVQNAFRFGTRSSGSTLRGVEVIGGYYYAVKLESEWNGATRSAAYAARNITIEDCVLHGSGRDVIKITPDANGTIVRRNEIYGSGLRDASNAEGIDNVNADNMVVQDNYIHDIATNGVYAKGGASNAVIERNRIENVGVTGVTLGFYTDAEFFDAANTQYYESIDSTVRNNVVVNARYAGIGMYAALRPRVHNNTLVNVATGGHAGVLFAPGDVATGSGTVASPSRDAEVYNNIVVAAGGRPSVQVRANGLAGTLGIDHNRYQNPSGAATFRDERAGFVGGLAAWRTRTGGDARSTEGAPGLDAAHHLAAGSPLIDAGLALATFANDVDGDARPQGGAWDVGADEARTGTSPPPPPADTAPPTAAATAAGITAGGGTSHTFTVRYADNVGVNAATLGAADVLVTGPNGYSQPVALSAVSGSGTSVTATYTIPAPGGAWDRGDNGTYALTLQAGQVADTAGNAAPAAGLGTFSVAVPDTTPPAVSGVSATGVTTTSATINWATDEPADSQVQYGTTTAYGSATTIDPARVTGHAVALGGLAAGTTYHYRVLSRDAAGNLTASGDFTFATAAAVPATAFSPATGYTGDFANYTPTTASRWQMATEGGDRRLFLNTSAYDAPAEDLVGEVALINGRTYGDFDLTLNAKVNESLSANPSADYVVVFGYQDARNYSYLMMNGRATNTRFFRVTNGVARSFPAAARSGVADTNWHSLRLSRTGSQLTAWLDGTQILSTNDVALGGAGTVGVGSYNDSVYFDNIAVTAR